MRTTLYTFLLAMALVLAPVTISWAGTDDSGLQMFTVDFSKQLGEGAEVAQEDTLLSPYCYNMFTSGNGLCSFPKPKGTGYAFNINSTSYLDGVNLYQVGGAIVRANESIYLHYNSGFNPSPLGGRVLLDENVSASYNSDLFAFSYGGTQAVFVGKKIISISSVGPSPVTAEVVLTAGGSPFSVSWKSAAIWQNRLFLVYQNYLYYSAAQNFTDFTSSASAGGVIRLYESSYIQKIISTKYGLYIFTGDGIWLQSGNSFKNSWQIEKISNLVSSAPEVIKKHEDEIYFKTSQLQGKKVWIISGIQVKPVLDIPQFLDLNVYSPDNYYQIAILNSGRFIVLATFIPGGTSWIYDTQNKTWTRSGEFNGFFDKDYYLKQTSYSSYQIYQTPVAEKFANNYDSDASTPLIPLYPWAYQTAWLTLDGNASNRKEIDRIEFDYQGGTTSVCLFYAYGNGSFSGSSTTLTAPTSARMSTYVWNAPIGRQQSNRFALYFLSSGAQTMTTNYILKQTRIYYRNIGNYKNNNLR